MNGSKKQKVTLVEVKLAMAWWHTLPGHSKAHLKRVSNLQDATSIVRYWRNAIATPAELENINGTDA